MTLNVEFSSLEIQATVEFYQELNDPNLTVQKINIEHYDDLIELKN